MSRGMFITFEGGDGTGKTTQAEALRHELESQGLDVLRTREPGGTDVGLKIREILLHTDTFIHPRAEALLFAADRAQNIHTQVLPALTAGTFVVQDRYIDSTLAYQGAGRSLNQDDILTINLWASAYLLPDLTVLLDLDPAAASARVAAEGKGFDRLEAEAAEFRVKLREGFLRLAESDPDRFLVVDATLPAGTITDLVVSEVIRRSAAKRLG